MYVPDNRANASSAGSGGGTGRSSGDSLSSSQNDTASMTYHQAGSLKNNTGNIYGYFTEPTLNDSINDNFTSAVENSTDSLSKRVTENSIVANLTSTSVNGNSFVTELGNYNETNTTTTARTLLGAENGGESRAMFQRGSQWLMSTGYYNNGTVNNATLANVYIDYSNVSTDLLNATTTPYVPSTYLLSGYSPLHVALSSIVVTAIMIGIVFGNILVIMAIAKDRNLQSIQNWFITSLAVADLLVGGTVMPFSLANELMGWWYFGDILCEVWLAVDVLLSTASILNLCLISLDRYWSITRAITYVKFRTRKRAMMMIAIVWVLSAIICFPPLVGWKRPQRKLFGFPLCELTDDIGYVLYSTLGSFYIPLVVMVVVYFKIYLAARSRARRGLKKKNASAANASMGNGKCTSTSTTTTSFSTPTRAHKHMEDHDKDMSSDEDDHCPHVDDLDSPSTDPDPSAGEAIKLNTDPSGAHLPKTKPFDERRKLLSDDTDVTDSADSTRPILVPPHVDNRHARRIHFSDSESTSDCSYGQARQNIAFRLPKHECINENENAKPLLEDQSAESNRDTCNEPETEVWVKRPELIVNNLHADNNSLTQNNNENSNASCQQNSAEQKKKKLNVLNVSNLSRTGSILTRKKDNIEKEKEKEKQIPKRSIDDPEKMKRRIAKARERRATFVLGIIMAVFIFCWLPFFLSYLIVSLARIDAPKILFAIFFWAGYCNSALNPIIYTIFNKDFRLAFKKLLTGKRHH